MARRSLVKGHKRILRVLDDKGWALYKVDSKNLARPPYWITPGPAKELRNSGRRKEGYILLPKVDDPYDAIRVNVRMAEVASRLAPAIKADGIHREFEGIRFYGGKTILFPIYKKGGILVSKTSDIADLFEFGFSPDLTGFPVSSLLHPENLVLKEEREMFSSWQKYNSRSTLRL